MSVTPRSQLSVALVDTENTVPTNSEVKHSAGELSERRRNYTERSITPGCQAPTYRTAD